MNIEREKKIKAARLKQSIEELRRKAGKAICKSNLWTQEEFDLVRAEANEMSKYLNSGDES